MPLALDPDATLWVWLEHDEKKDPRPEFKVRFMSRRELSKAVRLMDDARTASDYDAAHACLDAVFTIGVVGWRNIEGRGDFAVDKLDEILSGPERFELANLMIERPRMTELEKKRSSSKPTATPDSSVPDAATASA